MKALDDLTIGEAKEFGDAYGGGAGSE